MANLPTIICPVCGTDNPTTRQFCRKCASDLHAIVPAPAQPIAPPVAPVTTTTSTTTASVASTATSSPSMLRPILIGGGIALLILILIGGALLVLGGGSPAASPTPAPTASTLPTTAPVSAAPTAAPITAAPTPTAAPVKTQAPTPTKAPSTSPTVTSFSAPHTASCTGTNGTSTPGYIHLSWSASNATGVRLSIDPPSPANAYNYGYADYPAVGSDDVPFTCDPPLSDANGKYHLYVVTTLHTTGHYAYRYMKVYIKP